MAQVEHAAWRIFIARGDHGDVATLFGKRLCVGLCGEDFADLNVMEEQRVKHNVKHKLPPLAPDRPAIFAVQHKTGVRATPSFD
jgi:hypothetical protein